MHEIRSIVTEGGKAGVLAAKKISPRAGEAGPTGLAGIAIPRQEARKTNQRREDRHLNLVEGAEIVFRRKRYEVDVINVSSHGVLIASDIEPRLGERIDIRFEECNRAECAVRWIKGRHIGLEFVHETVLIAPTDIRELIVSGRRSGEHPPKLEMKHDRAERRHLIWTGVLHQDCRSLDVRLRNISADGAMLDCGEDLLTGTSIVLELAGAAALVGRVCWCRSGQIGVKFDERFDMRLLASVDPRASAAPSYVKPDYLASEWSPDSRWAAGKEALKPEDL